DGKEVSTKVTGGALPDNTGTQPLRIGANSLEEDKFFNGAVDEIRVWNRSLNASEISNLSNNNISNSIDPIVYLDFKENGDKSIVLDLENNKTLQTNKSVNKILEKEQKKPNINEKIDVQAWNELLQQKSGNTQQKDTHLTTDKTNFNIAVAGDFGCSTRAQENIKNIELQKPELFLALGDLAYSPTPDCWFTMTKNIDSITKIAIGNHEDKEESEGSDVLIQQYLDHYQLANSYYSFSLKNLHVLVLNTQLEFSVDTVASYVMPTATTKNNDKSDSKDQDQSNLGVPDTKLEDLLKKYSLKIKVPKLDKLLDKTALVPDLEVDPKQYEFAADDLKKASNDESIDWIFVIFHKPMYSSPSKQLEEYIIREKYQPLFDQYNVDLVLQGHNHIYDRTLPIRFNSLNITDPIVDKANDNSYFTNPDGTIYTVVGTGGKGPVRISGTPFYTVSQDKPVAGFLNIDINGKDLEATFYDIGLKCEEIKSKKTGKPVLDIESCKPRDESTQLKIVDTYKISKR
ncbi:MAG TPA: metallophosphoesterase, partial [Nitrososphaeraceae archaeon]|nr:metallophosphoesterase [Nitrososphaeraceae archaeon]